MKLLGLSMAINLMLPLSNKKEKKSDTKTWKEDKTKYKWETEYI